jgi:hypothetical protein
VDSQVDTNVSEEHTASIFWAFSSVHFMYVSIVILTGSLTCSSKFLLGPSAGPMFTGLSAL